MPPVVVARCFSYPAAHLARETLAAGGVAADLFDEQVVSANWLLGRAVGGIRILVDETRAADAIEILAADGRDALADLPEWQLPPSPDEVCPSCGGDQVRPPRWSRNVKAASMYYFPLLLFAVMAVVLERNRCLSCRRRW